LIAECTCHESLPREKERDEPFPSVTDGLQTVLALFGSCREFGRRAGLRDVFSDCGTHFLETSAKAALRRQR
jgi:hypothetical protein